MASSRNWRKCLGPEWIRVYFWTIALDSHYSNLPKTPLNVLYKSTTRSLVNFLFTMQFLWLIFFLFFQHVIIISCLINSYNLLCFNNLLSCFQCILQQFHANLLLPIRDSLEPFLCAGSLASCGLCLPRPTTTTNTASLSINQPTINNNKRHKMHVSVSPWRHRGIRRAPLFALSTCICPIA